MPTPKMDISLIVAVGTNGAMGVDGRLPWNIPQDVRLFSQITQGHPMIMGRRTMDEIKTPLPRRPNLVLSRTAEAKNGFVVLSSLDQALEYCAQRHKSHSAYRWDRVFIIGGAQLFATALHRSVADTIYRSIIDLTPPADTFFPALGPQWECVYSRDLPTHLSSDGPPAGQNGFFRFEVLKKKND